MAKKYFDQHLKAGGNAQQPPIILKLNFFSESKDYEVADENAEEVFECFGCQKSFGSSRNLNRHMKKCNQNAGNSLRCFLCDKTFSNKGKSNK